MVTLLRPSQYRRSVWKNGLGHTDEIAIYPEGADLKAGNFLWRISSAQIERASLFSVFPAHDRTLVILEGEGVRLTHTFEGTEDTTDVGPLEPYDFPGDVPSRCELLGGSVRDLSVFIRKAEVDSLTEVQRVAAGDVWEWAPEGRWNFAYVVAGVGEVVGGERTPLRAADTVRIDVAAGAESSCQFEAAESLTLVCVSVG